ncbi:MAG: hypothetical protein QOD61_1270, partial [Solirubrobacteraceae bacterium]|nr:hypothetical protein [Solirubrobacteraceae bacterium]
MNVKFRIARPAAGRQAIGSRGRVGSVIGKLDFVAVPSQDSERTRSFYVDTLGLRPDDAARFEFWAGETCFGIWEPERLGMPFAPQKNAHP